MSGFAPRAALARWRDSNSNSFRDFAAGGAMSLSSMRRSPRYSFSARLDVEWGSTALRAEVCDLSREGMMLRMPQPLWVGATFKARMALAEPLVVDCVVRRVLPGQGIGVEFVAVPSTSHDRLSSLLDELAGAPQ
jgi:hypothetical protein